MVLPYKQAADLPTRFAPVAKANYPPAVASAPVLSMTKEQMLAAHQKFLSDAQVKIDAMWVKGSCSKEEVQIFASQMCPF